MKNWIKIQADKYWWILSISTFAGLVRNIVWFIDILRNKMGTLLLVLSGAIGGALILFLLYLSLIKIDKLIKINRLKKTIENGNKKLKIVSSVRII
jgi:hypothetical protein